MAPASSNRKDKQIDTAWDRVGKQLTSSNQSLGAAAFCLGAGIAVGLAAVFCPDTAGNMPRTMMEIATTLCLVAPIEAAVSHWKYRKAQKQLKKRHMTQRELDAVPDLGEARKKAFLTNAWHVVEDKVLFQRAATAATGLLAGFAVAGIVAQGFVTAVAGSAVAGALFCYLAKDLGKTVKANLEKVGIKIPPVPAPVTPHPQAVFSGLPAAQMRVA